MIPATVIPTAPPVIPAKAGIQWAAGKGGARGGSDWIPAFAGMTGKGRS
jgi:hypothetical protein